MPFFKYRQRAQFKRLGSSGGGSVWRAMKTEETR